MIPNFSLVGSVLSRNHGLATFVHERLEVDQSPEQSETGCLCVDVAGYKIINVYKPPRSRFTSTAIPTFPHPSLYVGDFNPQHVSWGYNKTSPDGKSLDSWATSKNLSLLYNPKEIASFLERWHQSRPGRREFWPGQPTDGQTYPRKVFAVTTSVFPYNANEAQGSCPQRSGEALELCQGWLEALLPFHRDESVERLPPPDTRVEKIFSNFHCGNAAKMLKYIRPMA